ncbi:HAD-superfamily phosphatase, subfamily IIIC/FkbH-like domain-containing protein [Sinosporangium album]|uniref:HAD-superfamily phosphatase, subfamily IIIC/FkbH-like domain-containing protein n=1 Tax=Sinosporangium album TaxID=504805 RepID=A0A1G7YFF4_9ACTN|nr:HAD-IIIC family phosphatase [Sinosporangium album]SDG95067.1 HAD-superfamily phosphatase, subfamily IIIC/FkbH-like domain-containing protein [Sinosporangium album]
MSVERVAELFRAGRLAAEYPLVRGLLSAADGDGLRRAGHVLERLRPDDVLREHPDTSVLTVAVIGHGTVGTVVPVLTAELARHGLLMRPFLGDFQGYVVELGDPGSDLYAADPDLVLCVLDPAVVFDEVGVPWRVDDVERVLGEKVRLVERLAARFAETARGTLVLNTLPLTSHATAQVTDHRSRARLGAVWRAACSDLLRLGESNPSVVTIDLDPLIAEGIAVTDQRQSLYAGQHLSAELLARYAREIGHLARHLAGLTKKCLVVDLDGTLWGGILGDDGVEGIEVAGGYRGRAFTAFQRTVKQLASHGVLLAAVSKNDLGAVREALDKHPEMTLREDDFVRVIANWRPKHDNLRELAGDLNLSVDSMVFADDSAFECGLVRRELPGVAVVALDEEPALHAARLLADGWFDSRELTVEDRSRPRLYREELVRKDFLDSFASLDDYLTSLDVRVRLEDAADTHVSRISQLTLRTNQFNLTTRRLQPADVQAFAAEPGRRVLAVRTSDRFGENGLTGAIFVRVVGEVLHIDNFLLSCRVFSRGIEQACLLAVLRHASAAGLREVLGTYRPTAKNGKVRDFYTRNGFVSVDGGADGGVDRAADGGVDRAADGRADRAADGGADGAAWFRHDLDEIADPPAHVRLFDGLAVPETGGTAS